MVPLHRQLLHLLVAGTVFVQLGAVRPCYLDEVMTNLFQGPADSVDCAQGGSSISAPDEDADSPTPEHRPCVWQTRQNTVDDMHHADMTAFLFLEPPLICDLLVFEHGHGADYPFAIPPPTVSVSFPLLI